MITQEQPVPLRDYLFAFYAVMIFSSGNSAVQFIVDHVPPLTALGIRFGITAVIFAPFARWPGWCQIALIAQIAVLLSVLHQGLLFYALTRINVSLSVILIQTQVIFAAGLSWLFLRESIGIYKATGILLGITGVIVLVGLPAHPPDFYGTAACLISALGISLAYMRMKALARHSAATYIAWLHIAAAPLTLLIAFMFEEPLAVAPATFLKPNVLGGMIWTIVMLSTTHLLWQRLMNRNPISQIVPFTLLMPFTGVALGVWLFDDRIGPAFITGGLMTIAGIAMIILQSKKPLERR